METQRHCLKTCQQLPIKMCVIVWSITDLHLFVHWLIHKFAIIAVKFHLPRTIERDNVFFLLSFRNTSALVNPRWDSRDNFLISLCLRRKAQLKKSMENCESMESYEEISIRRTVTLCLTVHEPLSLAAVTYFNYTTLYLSIDTRVRIITRPTDSQW